MKKPRNTFHLISTLRNGAGPHKSLSDLDRYSCRGYSLREEDIDDFSLYDKKEKIKIVVSNIGAPIEFNFETTTPISYDLCEEIDNFMSSQEEDYHHNYDDGHINWDPFVLRGDSWYLLRCGKLTDIVLDYSLYTMKDEDK